jgi:N-carbamoyl-L-amino-acid hydrolase
MLAEARAASESFATEEGCTVEWSKIWSIEPISFHPRLIALCDEAIRETAGATHSLPSGPLHDAAEVARSGVPTVMMFTQSLAGLSHNKAEDTRVDHLVLAVEAFDRLARKTLTWLSAQDGKG